MFNNIFRQGKVHARVSVSWASEFGAILRIPLNLNWDLENILQGPLIKTKT